MTSHINKYNDVDLYSMSHYEKANFIRSIKAKLKKASKGSYEYTELTKSLNRVIGKKENKK